MFGVRDSAQDGPGDVQLADLINAHHYTDGVAIVPQGSPTNNTSDASSAFSTADPDQTISYAVEVGADLAAEPSVDGAVLADALGLPLATVSHLRYADGHGTANSADMVTALWPSTVGYFLEQMMSPVFSAAQQEAMRIFARSYVRPRGPVPAHPSGIHAVRRAADHLAGRRGSGQTDARPAR